MQDTNRRRRCANGSSCTTAMTDILQSGLARSRALRAEITSGPGLPIEAAFAAGPVSWLAPPHPGAQVIRLVLDAQGCIICIAFAARRRVTGIVVRGPQTGQSFREIVRQQYHFSLPGPAPSGGLSPAVRGRHYLRTPPRARHPGWPRVCHLAGPASPVTPAPRDQRGQARRCHALSGAWERQRQRAGAPDTALAPRRAGEEGFTLGGCAAAATPQPPGSA